MASAVTTDYLSSTIKVLSFDFDPNETAATDVSWQDMRDFGAVLMQVFISVGTGGLSSFAILANAQSNGGGTDATVKTHALGTAPDAVGDIVNLECLASEFPPLNPAGVHLRYVSAAISLVTATDECVVVYVFGQPRFAFGSLTADVIA
jgi:hypothetical protein